MTEVGPINTCMCVTTASANNKHLKSTILTTVIHAPRFEDHHRARITSWITRNLLIVVAYVAMYEESKT